MSIPANRLSRAGSYRPSSTSNYPSVLLGRDAARLRFSASIPAGVRKSTRHRFHCSLRLLALSFSATRKLSTPI